MLKLFKNRRSIRKYKDIAVSTDYIKQIIEGALISPTSRNRKPIEFIIVEDKKLLEELISCKKAGTEALKSCPLAIVVLGNKDKSDVWVEDGSIASTFIMIQAEALGLSSCWIQIKDRESHLGKSEDIVRSLLNIPENFGVLNIITLGYKAENKTSYTNKDMDFTKIHRNIF